MSPPKAAGAGEWGEREEQAETEATGTAETAAGLGALGPAPGRHPSPPSERNGAPKSHPSGIATVVQLWGHPSAPKQHFSLHLLAYKHFLMQIECGQRAAVCSAGLGFANGLYRGRQSPSSHGACALS